MNKLVRKLALSIVAVVLAALTFTTTTYAWFSMNGTVSVNGLEMNVVNESEFLIIGTSSDIATLQNDNLKEVTAQTTGKSLKPAAHKEDAGATAFTWYCKTADSPTASASTSTATTITDEKFSEYVLLNTFYITTAVGSSDMKDLTVSACSISTAATGKTNVATRVLVVTETSSEEFSPSKTVGSTVLAAEITDTTVIKVSIYVFYDGNDSTVYTNNALNLDGAKITIAFTATQK